MEPFFAYIIIPLFIGFGFGFLVGKAKRNPKPKDPNGYWSPNYEHPNE